MGREKGYKHSEATKRKIGLVHKGKRSGFKNKKHSLSSRKKMSDSKKGKPSPRKGKKLSKETIQKILNSKGYKNKRTNKGMKYSKEARENMSRAHIGNKSPMKGKHLSLNVRNKMSESRRGKKLPKKTKLKISKSMVKLLQRTSYKMRYKYKNIPMRSNWEVRVAEWLDDNSIKWEYESDNCIFKLSNGKTHLIDFYLPELNKHIEVKGWWSERSIKRFSEVKEKLNMCIIDKRNIKNISLNLKEIPKS